MARQRRGDRERAAVLHLRHRGRHGIREIARILGLPRSTVSDMIREGPAKIGNPRLRIVAEAAVERGMLRGAEWDELRDEVLAQGGQEAWFAEAADNTGAQDTPVQTGSMVAFFLPALVADVLALDPDQVDGEVSPPGELHLTLAYLGEAADLEEPDRLKRVVAGFAAIAPPVDGEISGVGRFATGDRPVYASFDAPALPEWRQRLVQHLKMAGYPPAATHGFTPHVTLAYPDGPVPLDVSPLRLEFGTLTLTLGADRYDWPLEGSAALFAEYRMAERGAAEPDPVPEEEEEVEALPPPDPGPPIMDKLLLRAVRRYFVALANGSGHFEALHVAQKVDHDFSVTEAQGRRAIHALGLGDQPVRFSQAGRIPPPRYVQSVYAEFEFTEDQVRALAAELFEMAQEGYLDGLNAQLMTLGQPIASAVEDADVLVELEAESGTIAAGIANTYNRDLAAEVYTEWIELRAERGSQMSRRWLEEAVDRWATGRAAWKAEQIALTEINRWWNRAAFDFAERNADRGLVVTHVYVTPDECVCDACLDLVAGNPYTLAEAAGLGLPLHPKCVHFAELSWEPADVQTLANLWFAQAA